MKNIEIKQIIDGKFAIVLENSFGFSNGMYGNANISHKRFLNLDNLDFFETYKINESTTIYVNREISNSDSDNPIFIDGLPEESDLFKKSSNTVYSNPKEWEIIVPKDTPLIYLSFSSGKEFVLHFLHHGEYKKFMRILTETK